MSALESLLNDVKKSSGGNTVSLAVTVEEWEDTQIKGVRMDTGEQVVVRLNNFEKKPESSFDRPDLKSIKENKRAGKGAVVLFESAYFNAEDGAWYSRWANLIVKSERDKKTVARILRSKITVGKSKSGKEYIEIKALAAKVGQKVPNTIVSSLEELSEIAKAHLVPMGNGVTPYLLAYADDGEQNFSFEIRASLIETTSEFGERKLVVDPVAENSMNKFLSTDYGDILKACVEHPDVKIKVAKGKIIYCGKATRDNMIKRGKAEFMRKEFMLDKEAQYATQNLGYKDVLVGVREDEEIDSKFAVSVDSISPYSLATPAKDLLE